MITYIWNNTFKIARTAQTLTKRVHVNTDRSLGLCVGLGLSRHNNDQHMARMRGPWSKED